MPRRIVVTATAQDCLDQVGEYVYLKSRNFKTANRLLDDITDKVIELAETPGIGHARRDLTSLPFGFCSVHRYLIVFEALDDKLIVHFVLHGARDVARLIAEAQGPVHKIVIATHNRKKAREMIQILSERFPSITFQTLADFPNAPEPEETGSTYEANAAIKAESACLATGKWCLADDAGLEIDAMGGEPGLYSRRFAGEDTPFPEKMQIILERLKDTPEPQRAARFRCCVAVARPNEPTDIFTATCEGRIAREPSGGGGFGYDPIFYLPELGCTMADLTAEQKHAISHRGKVLAQVGDWLAERI